MANRRKRGVVSVGENGKYYQSKKDQLFKSEEMCYNNSSLKMKSDNDFGSSRFIHKRFL